MDGSDPATRTRGRPDQRSPGEREAAPSTQSRKAEEAPTPTTPTTEAAMTITTSPKGDEVTCEVKGCEQEATHYGGQQGAFYWAGHVCPTHLVGMSWYEELERPTDDRP